MKLPYLSCLLPALALSAPTALAQRFPHCTPNKSQVIARAKIAEMDAAAGRLDREAFRTEIEDLRREGKINDEQLASLRKALEIPEPANAPGLAPAALVVAQQALDRKLAELDERPDQPVPPTNPEVRAKAEEELAKQMAGTSQPQTATDPAAAALAQQALDRKMAELNASATPTSAAPPADAEARAREALDRKMAELAQPAAPNPVSDTDRRSVAELALAAKMAELARAEGKPVAATPLAKPVEIVTPGPSQSASETQALAAAALAAKMNELRTGSAAMAATPESQVRAQRALNERLTELTGAPPAPVALPLRLTKQGWERLDELSELYRAGQVTPQEYHTERARIVAGMLK